MFISYTSGGNGNIFSASLAYGKKVPIFFILIIFSIIRLVLIIFALLKDNLCNNALDLTKGHLIVENNLPLGTYCQWLISAQNVDAYVTLEFQNFHVKIILYLKRMISLCK